ncbi:MAG: carboxypeptidase regulatory-like domain-containing protein, partial [Terriglobia bacterium]
MVPAGTPVAVSRWFSAISLAIMMLVALAPTQLRAQVSGATLTGSVTDPSGAVIPNAKVSIKNTATGIVTDVTTNSAGLYTAPNLIPGPYEVTVSAQGFQTEVRTGIVLTVGAQQVLNETLRVGQTTQTISVSGQAPTVQLASSSLAAQVNSTTVRQLPLNGRDWASLATLQPGVAQVRTQENVTQIGGAARGVGMQMTIDGNRPTQNSYRLDGIVINDYSNAGPGSVLGQNLGVDAVQEFSVLTNNYSAEYGFTSGGVINAITRSGTNQFHGSVYEFLRNSNLDAANFFDNAGNIQKPPFRRNQFGASAGGPVKKDKIFIFGDYEGLRQDLGQTNTAFTPSPAMRLGNIHDAAGNPFTVTVDPTIAKFFTFYPLPNNGLIPPGDTGRYVFSGQQVVPENYWTARGDVRISDRDSMYATWYWDHSVLSQPDAMNQVVDAWTTMRTGGVAEETHIFSPATVNSLRVGWNRSVLDSGGTPRAINPSAADQSFGMLPGFFAPRITVGGLTLFTGGLRGQSVQNYISQLFQVYDDAFHTIGNHSLKFGFEFLRDQDNVYAPFTEDGNATFSSLANFLTNQALFGAPPAPVATIAPHYLRSSIFGGYLQDDWKARPSLTLNVGLRYEMATIPTEVQGKIANLPTINTDPGNCPSYSNCPALNHFFFSENPSLKNFEPRIGFAWDPFHNGKTAIRGGFGVFDALQLPYEMVINNAQTSPAIVSGTATNLPVGAFPFGIPALTAAPPNSQQTWNYVEPTPKRNYIFQYNFNIQRQITASTAVTLAYAGSRAVHQPFQVDTITFVMPTRTSAGYLYPNPIGSGTSNNPNSFDTQTSMWQSGSYYNAFQAEVVRKMNHGVQLQGSFTWSKTIDNSSGSFAGDNYG